MKREELYKRTVDILVQAYFDNTLQHGNCYACAVGNIVAGNMGIRFFKGKYGSACDINEYLIWEGKKPTYCSADQKDDYRTTITSVVCTLRDGERVELTENIKKQLLSTGYTLEELIEIENSFEKVDFEAVSDDERMFNGLMRVVDALDKIHENNDVVATQVAKKRFEKVSI